MRLANKKKVGGNDEALRQTQVFMRAHLAAYGTDLVKPKHHFVFHNGLQFRDRARRVVVDCFVHERKHQVAKAAASPIKNTVAFEASVLGKVVLAQLRQLEGLPAERGLESPVVPDVTLGFALGFGGAVQVSRKMRFDGMQLAVDDLVLFGTQGGRVVACVEANASYFVVVEEMRCQAVGICNSTWTPKVDFGFFLRVFFLGVRMLVLPTKHKRTHTCRHTPKVALLAVDLEHTDLRLPYAWAPSGHSWLILHA